MSTYYKPREMTEEEKAKVLAYTGDALEYYDDWDKVGILNFESVKANALVYATDQNVYVSITVMGHVGIHEDLEDALVAAFEDK